MNIANVLHSPRSSLTWDQAPPALEEGQIVAVISGEGQGWMAVIVAVRQARPEALYSVILGDGRTLWKHDRDLAELNAIGDAGWPEPNHDGH